MNRKVSLLLGLAALLGINQKTDAAGFALIEQSVSSMGNAYAGGAAVAEDATTIFFNPAGITRICGNQIIGGAHIVLPVADYDDDGSILFPGVNPPGLVAPNDTQAGETIYMTGNNGRDAGENALVGNFYWSHQVNNCWHVGLGITAPFGLVTDYDGDWKGRYHAQRSALLTIDINPVVAYKFNKCWSVGGGFRALYAHAKLTSAVDYGTIAWLATLTQQSPDTIREGLNQLDFQPQEEDGHVELKGNAWGWGGNFGILYEPCCGTRFGFNWRSQVKLRISGDEKFSSLPDLIENPQNAPEPLIPFFAGLQAAAATDSRAKSDVTLPDMYQFSAYHELNSCWAIMGDITWTRWETLKRLRFRFNNENQPDGITTLEWQNTLRYSLGATYSPNACWKFRTGVAYDETPVKNKELRTPRIPDEDRFWLAFGLGYNWSSCLHFDFGYAHLFVREPKINKTDFEYDEDFTRGGLKGHYNAYTDIVSAQVVWNF